MKLTVIATTTTLFLIATTAASAQNHKFSNSDLRGRYSYSATVWFLNQNVPTPSAFQGQCDFDGDGHATCVQTNVDFVNGISQNSQYTRTYQINEDGSGTSLVIFNAGTPNEFSFPQQFNLSEVGERILVVSLRQDVIAAFEMHKQDAH